VIRLDDRVAIITGSGRGLGAAYAQLLADRGARVVIHDIGVNKDGTGFDPNVLTTSDRAIYPQYALNGLAPYAMGKMAQIGLMNVLAAEGSLHGIIVNAISPVAKTRMWNVQDEPEDLRPEQVAPGVLYLASSECRESGFILRAANGQFTAVRWVERENVDYPLNLAAVECSTAEDLASSWQEVATDVAF
jgi:NAD(P)-dependent dehydrogenase (short-subunit alcohol dehydrogenase family)